MDKMTQDQLIAMFDSLTSKQRVRVALRACMGHGDAENGVPTEYIVGRRGNGRSGQTVSLAPADGSKAHSMCKVKLHKSRTYDGQTFVQAVIGDMAATLVSIETV